MLNPTQPQRALRLLHSTQKYLFDKDNLEAPHKYVESLIIFEDDSNFYVHQQAERKVDLALIGTPTIGFPKSSLLPFLANLPSIVPLEHIPAGTFVKTPNEGMLDVNTDPRNIALVMQREIELWETVLWAALHPNICGYFGVVNEDGERATGIVLKKYGATLAEVVERKEAVDVAKAMRELDAGLAHLHSLGLVNGSLQRIRIITCRC